jgi:hypothetical protein
MMVYNGMQRYYRTFGKSCNTSYADFITHLATMLVWVEDQFHSKGNSYRMYTKAKVTKPGIVFVMSDSQNGYIFVFMPYRRSECNYKEQSHGIHK